MTLRRLTAPVLAAVAVGGAAGASLRWWLGTLAPDDGGFPWTTFAINVAGSFLLALLPRLTTRPLVVAALGPGLLGGFTTLSAYAEQGRALVADGQAAVAAAYVVGTLAACLLAVHVASLATTAAQRKLFEAEEGNE